MENKHIIAAGGIGLLIVLVILFLFQTRSSQDSNPPLSLDFNKKQTASAPPVIKELQMQDLKIGTGSAEVEIGDTIIVHYAGFLTDGRKFDSSYDRKQPFTVDIGAGKVIRGFDQGVIKMKIGGKRRIFIPSEFGYGPSGQGPIPPNADLIFEVELLDIKKKEEPTPSPTPSPSTNPEPTSGNPTETPTPSP